MQNNIEISKSKVFKDNRGHFLEIYNKEKQYDLPEFVQSNLSFSKQNSLKGLHFQNPPFVQGKYIFVIFGSIFDVIVDINKYSPTYGHWWGNVLKENESLFIDKNYAHGFFAIKDSLVLYNVTNSYNKDAEKTIKFDDINLNIKWPIKDKNKLIISKKDKEGIRFKDL